MSKTLSLKKSKTNASKNQQPITQFFKNVTNDNKSPVKESSVESKSNSRMCKRKVSLVEQSNVLRDELKSSKKCKIGNNNVSLEKQKNTLSIVQSPEKLSTNFKFSPEKNINRTVNNDKESSCCVDNKSPLLSLSPNTITGHVKATCNLDSKKCKEWNIYKKENQVCSHTYDNHDDNIQKYCGNTYKSPKKSPKEKEKVIKITSPLKSERSPSKFEPVVKVLEFNQNDVPDVFGDDWELDNFLDNKEDLDLTVMQRCEILCIIRHPQKIELKLRNDNNSGTCFIEGIWVNTSLQQGEIISVLARRDSSGQFSINNTSGLLTLRPDHLMSSTSVVAGVFCKRKAILQERWRGIDSANTAMTIGILIHELVQKALTHNINKALDLVNEADKIIKDSTQLLYDAGITEQEAHSNMEMYIKPLSEFMATYVSSQHCNKNIEKHTWNGKIEKVLDIEENLCCPKLGLKGKIDATLQVTIHDRKNITAIVPLELKSGRSTMSAEHRGQLFLYGMMLSLQRQEDPTTAMQRGLLLYLKERVDLKEVSCGYPERRDLIMLRNELVQHLASGPQDFDTEKLVDIEDASRLLQQTLPEPVHHPTACAKCPYLTICSLHLWHTEGPEVSESHPLAKLKDDALGHLSSVHIKYFLHWTCLLRLEEREQMTASPLHALWTDSVEKRSKRGVCAANLKLKEVSDFGDKFLHVFIRQSEHTNSLNEARNAKGPQEGDFSIVSIKDRPWIAAGVVTVSNNIELNILLERDLSRRLDHQTLFHIDTYESYATTVQNLTNLGVLMEDSDRATGLRRLIIEKDKPEFASKLPRDVGKLGVKLMRPLNIEQQRAVLRALSAEHYALLRGLPGTGKTQTISVLIQMLVALKQRVLVTAHTHSAVDTVLNRLPAALRVLRLGAARRAAATHAALDRDLLRDARDRDHLALLYDSMEVVGVTCLGANHPMLARTTFDVCIVDEATQVLQCTVLRPLFSAKRFVLVGDPEQLPPVVKSKSARRLGMEESLFHRLMVKEATSTLRLQYRMNQPLVDVANKVAYNDSLKCANETVAQAKLKIDFQKISSQYLEESPWLVPTCSPDFNYAAIFLNLELGISDKVDNEKTLTNIEEACVVMTIIDTLKKADVSPADIGVIAPYRDQVSLLRRCLTGQDIDVSTVDQFQGKDKDVIIYSCTKRDKQDGRTIKEGEVLNDQRRLAVSVTRAKHKFIVIGDLRALRRYATLVRLIEACTPIVINQETIQTLQRKYGNVIK